MSRMPRWTPCLVVVFGLALTLATLPSHVSAQTGLSLSVGNALYSDDAFCLGSDAFITSYDASLDGSVFGASASYNNSDWPWPPPGTGGSGGGAGGGAAQQGNYLTHGDAFSVVAKLFPLTAIARSGGADGLRSVDRILRPFIGVGVQVSTDGEPAPAGGGRDLPTYGVRGQTNPLLAFGASLEVPMRASPLGLVVTYRHTVLFSGDFEIDTGAQQDLVIPSATLNWGTVSVGVRIRVAQ